jgi:hypothetical protein
MKSTEAHLDRHTQLQEPYLHDEQPWPHYYLLRHALPLQIQTHQTLHSPKTVKQAKLLF